MVVVLVLCLGRGMRGGLPRLLVFYLFIYFSIIKSCILAGCLGICGRFPTQLGGYFPGVLQDRQIKLANLEIVMPWVPIRLNWWWFSIKLLIAKYWILWALNLLQSERHYLKDLGKRETIRELKASILSLLGINPTSQPTQSGLLKTPWSPFFHTKVLVSHVFLGPERVALVACMDLEAFTTLRELR